MPARSACGKPARMRRFRVAGRAAPA